MFGIDLGSFIVILIVAIIFLGPDKLPEMIVQIVKFWRTLKSGVQDAKETLQKEIDLNELKNTTMEYKNSAEDYVKELSSRVDLYGTQESTLGELNKELLDVKSSVENKVESEITAEHKNV